MNLGTLLKLIDRKKKPAPVPEKPAPKTYLNTPRITCPHCDFEHPLEGSPPQNCAIGCDNCGMPFMVEVYRTGTGNRTQLPTQSHGHAEFVKTFTTKPMPQHVNIVDKIPLPDIKTSEEAVAQYNAGHITIEQLRDLHAQHADWKFWDNCDVEDGRNPFYPEGDPRSRESGATYHPRHHPKGIFFQQVIKVGFYHMINLGYGAMVGLFGRRKANRFKRMLIRQALSAIPNFVEFANRTMITQYDKASFEFSDPFLVALREVAHEHIAKNFQWDYGRVEQLMLKGTDLTLVFLREDMPYRLRFKLMLNDIIKRYPNGFPLTPAEEKWYAITQEIVEKCKRDGGASVVKMPTFK